MKIVTFNLRCAWAEDGVNSFIHRGGMILEKIKDEKPDLLCFQEGTDENISFLRRALPDYDIVFSQRNSDLSGEGVATALRRDSMTLKKLDFFWLSETPDAPGSIFPGQSIPRVCQSLLIRDSHGRFLRVYNVHLDHLSDEIRVLNIRCLLSRVAGDCTSGDYPFFILGDFNALPDSETVRYCNDYEPLPVVDLTAGCGGTFHDFGQTEPEKLDYIYASRQIAERPYTAVLWEDRLNGIYLSDHYPVALEIEL